ncbi:TrbI/VirB10 family protein [Gloeothece verrucosa]|uniref:TrbI/VirB10 family protein n=1 Tax=Gloeothece verrucosa TaxID=2546359 RepID=UPI0003080F64|nr:TrbI/VirB10 family protein [Gloeothece verrucosa]
MVNTIESPSVKENSIDDPWTNNEEINPSSESNWNCESINNLLELPNDDKQQLSNNIEEESTLFAEQEEQGSEQETQAKKGKSFSKNPYVKLGLIGLICGSGVIVAGIFLTNAPSYRSATATKEKQESTKEKDKTLSPEEQIALYKAEAALSSQSQQLKKMGEAADLNQPLPQPVMQSASNSETGEIPKVSVSQPSSPSNTSTEVSYRRQTPPSINSVPRTRGQISYSPAGNISRRYNDRPITLRNSSIAIKQQPTTVINNPTESVNPLELWQKLAGLGSYTASSKSNNDEGNTEVDNSSGDKVLDMSDAQEVDDTNNKQSQKSSRTPVILTSSKGNSEEMELLGDSPTQSSIIPVGTTVKGEMATSIIWAQGMKHSDPFVVTLSQSISDPNGVEVLPKGTEIIFEVHQIHDSGMVTGDAIAIRVNGKDIELPEGVFALRAPGGKPLIAKLRNDASRDIAKRDAMGFVVGALGKLGEIVNRPTSTSSSSGVGGFSQSST